MTDLAPLPLALRESLPDAVQAHLAALESENTRLRDELASQQVRITELEARLVELTARLNQHSQTSSRPPSAAPPSAPPRPKPAPSPRQRGGQPGHPGHHRPLKAVTEVEVVEHRPTTCPCCQAAIPADAPTVGQPQRQQVWDIPPIQPTVTEHQYYAVGCPTWRALVEAPRPPEVPPGTFGPRLVSLIGLLVGRYRLSQREVERVLEAVFEVPLSLGSVGTACEAVSAALAEPYAAVQSLVEAAPHANVDETGWKQAGQRRWLWVAVTMVVTLFRVALSRRRVEVSAVLGTEYQGLVTSDRFSAYRHLPIERRQVCWAHLARDLRAFSQIPLTTGAWGTRALAVVAQLFAVGHRFKDDAIDRTTLQAEMQPLREQFSALLTEGLSLPYAKARGFCADVQSLEPALWTFVVVAGVEPTNNAAERALRPAVLWRKGSFGSQSDGGARFVERILTVTATCRQHQRPLLPFLTAAVAAHWAGRPAPSLLPAT